MTALVFVSAELSPFTAGGVGRVLHNILRTMSDSDRARTIVLLVDVPVGLRPFQAVFPGVRLIQVDTSKDPMRHAGGRRVPPRWAYSDTRLHWQSAVVMLALENLARETPVAYVEFPDWGGLGFCALQEHRFSALLPDACMAVRLHSTHAVLLHAEARQIGQEDLCVVDMERKCLRDCDRIVAQLPAIGDSVRDLMAFPKSEWDQRVVIHAPPVLLDQSPHAVQAHGAAPGQSILFTSKMQRIKRPDLFVRGVSGFMRGNCHYEGKAYFNAHIDDPVYEEQVRSLVPVDLRPRFVFAPPQSSAEREAAIASATVVVPSEYESFCLAAYEASLLGARLVVNAANPAFGDTSPWIDGVNCFKFDGTASGLAAAMERSFSQKEPVVPVQLRQDPWPWESVLQPAHRGVVQASPQTSPLVSIIVPHYNLGGHLMQTVDNVLRIDDASIELLIIDDASTDADSIRLIDTLERSKEPRLRVIRLKANVGLAATRNIGVRNALGEYILTLDADDLINPGFVGRAVHALENHPQFDVVVTPAAYFLDNEEPPMEGAVDAVDYAVFTGEARVAGLLQNRFSTATAVFRKAVLERFPYDENLHCYEDWSLYMRLCDAGVRFIVTTDVFFFYRIRKNSMVHVAKDPSTRHIEYSDLLRTSAPARLRAGSSHLALGLMAPFIAGSPGGVATGSLEELLHRTAHLEQMMHSVFRATTPLEKLFRVPRFFWRKLRPARSFVARACGAFRTR